MEPGLENVQERETTVRPTVLVKLQTIPERILLPHTVRAWYYNFSFHWTWDSAAVCHQSVFASVSASNPCLCLLCSGLVSLIWPQFISVAQLCLFATPWIAACQASLSITNSWSLLKLMSIKSVMPSSHLILCRPLLPPVPPSIRVFSNESTLRMRWPKYWTSPDHMHGRLYNHI